MKLYKEQQTFNRPEIYALVGLFIVLALADLIKLILYPEEPFYLIMGIDLGILALAGGALLLLLRLRMKVSISDKSIKYQLYPFHSHRHKIRWSEVDEARIVDLPLESAMSGWGVHFSLLEKRISLCGYRGLFLRLKNGDAVMLGCRHTDALRENLSDIPEVRDR